MGEFDRSRRRSWTALALAGTLVLAGCGGSAAAGEGESAAPAPGVEAEAGTTTSAASSTAPLAPLTGLPTADGSLLDRPALVVKIDNDPAARPQSGLNQADMVYEIKVEGITRFAAVYHTGDADTVGPIRSARTSDRDLLPNLNRPLFAWSGGNPTVAGEVRDGEAAGNLVNLSHDVVSDEYRRDGTRAAPHNLYAATLGLRSHAPADAAAPAPVFTFRPAGSPMSATAVPTGGVAVDYGSGRIPSVEFAWDAEVGAWRRYQVDEKHSAPNSAHVDMSGEQVAPENVVILSMAYTQSPADGGSPQAISVDSGDAIVLSEGQMVNGTWRRGNNRMPFELVDANGEAIALAPGQTWVLLPEPGRTRALPADRSNELLTYRR